MAGTSPAKTRGQDGIADHSGPLCPDLIRASTSWRPGSPSRRKARMAGTNPAKTRGQDGIADHSGPLCPDLIRASTSWSPELPSRRKAWMAGTSRPRREGRTHCRSFRPALPGLDPGIHVLETRIAEPQEGVDGRDKPGQDERAGRTADHSGPLCPDLIRASTSWRPESPSRRKAWMAGTSRPRREGRTHCRSFRPALPGLDPGIHVLETRIAEPQEGVDGRDKPGQDERAGRTADHSGPLCPDLIRASTSWRPESPSRRKAWMAGTNPAKTRGPDGLADHSVRFLKLAGEGLVQQRLLESVERAKFALVNADEALRFF